MGLADAQDCLHVEGARQRVHFGVVASAREVAVNLRRLGRFNKDVVLMQG